MSREYFDAVRLLGEQPSAPTLTRSVCSTAMATLTCESMDRTSRRKSDPVAEAEPGVGGPGSLRSIDSPQQTAASQPSACRRSSTASINIVSREPLAPHASARDEPVDLSDSGLRIHQH